MQVLTLLSIHPHSFGFLFILVVFCRNVNAYAVYNKQQFGYACGIFGYSFSLISEIYCVEISMNIQDDSQTQVFEQNKFLESSFRAIHIYIAKLNSLYYSLNVHIKKLLLFFSMCKEKDNNTQLFCFMSSHKNHFVPGLLE